MAIRSEQLEQAPADKSGSAGNRNLHVDRSSDFQMAYSMIARGWTFELLESSPLRGPNNLITSTGPANVALRTFAGCSGQKPCLRASSPQRFRGLPHIGTSGIMKP
jgi:hypothetical protein